MPSRSQLLKKAASLPVGDPERRRLLTGLTKKADDLQQARRSLDNLDMKVDNLDTAGGYAWDYLQAFRSVMDEWDPKLDRLLPKLSRNLDAQQKLATEAVKLVSAIQKRVRDQK